MARSEGQVLQRKWKTGPGYALRFRAYGERQYITLGLQNEGWTPKRANQELQNILADVRRGTWIAPGRNHPHTAKAAGTGEATFQSFANEWLAARQAEVAPRTHDYHHWALHHHLLPYFANYPLADIDIEAVDAYRRYKVQQAEQRRKQAARKTSRPALHAKPAPPLSATSINKTIDVLQAILALAIEYGHLPANPAAGRRRRLRPPARRPIHIDTAHQISAVLAGRQLDGETIRRSTDRRAIVATLIFAGPRADELCHLLWRDIDLANGRIHIGRSKTQAGLREIPLLPCLRDELAAQKARAARIGPHDLVFPTRTGSIRDKDNLRNRVLAPVIECADQLLTKREHPPLPQGLTPHKLRHTFASVLIALGEDPTSVMAALGHTDPKFTLRTYTHLMRREPVERARLKALVIGATSQPTPPVGIRSETRPATSGRFRVTNH